MEKSNSNNSVRPKNYHVAEYAVYLDTKELSKFIKDARVKSAAMKTGCTVELTRRVLNKRVNGYKWVRYAIIQVCGPDESAIKQCNKILERDFPIYANRKEYSKRAPVTIYSKSSLPDMTQLMDEEQRGQNKIDKSIADIAEGYVEIDGASDLGRDVQAGFRTKSTANDEWGKACSKFEGMAMSGRHNMIKERVMQALASCSADPVILLFDREEITMVGSASLAMMPDNNGKLALNMETFCYKVVVSGDNVANCSLNHSNAMNVERVLLNQANNCSLNEKSKDPYNHKPCVQR